MQLPKLWWTGLPILAALSIVANDALTPVESIILGWAWFAGAGGLGAITGYVTSARERDAAVAPGWVVLALLVALGAGAALSCFGVFGGPIAESFGIALVLSASYLFGLPVGRAFKLLDLDNEHASVMAEPPAAPESSPVELLVTVAAVAGAQQAIPVIDDVASAAKALGATAIEMRARAKAARKPAGRRPPTLEAPRGAADDLTRIRGLGPKSAGKLNALGVFHYDQIAGWSRDNATWIGAEIGVAGRVERDDWIAQARKLAGVNEGESAASAA